MSEPAADPAGGPASTEDHRSLPSLLPLPVPVGPRCDEGKEDEEETGDGHLEETTVAIPSSRDDGDNEREGTTSCCAPRTVEFLTSSAFLIYCSQFLSAWGDRMWTFAVALYLVEIEDYSLRLTAVFGFALTVSVLLFGAHIGHWVDRTPRLTAARKSLVIQNVCVMLCAVSLLLLLRYKVEVVAIGNGLLFYVCQVVIIVLGVFANLASVAEKICIQKDWVVVLAGGSKERLAEMNASVRRIDLTVNILAPIIVGQIMTYTSMTVAGIFIAGWNFVSLIAEYRLLLRVYKKVPRLAMKIGKTEEDSTLAETQALARRASTDSGQAVGERAAVATDSGMDGQDGDCDDDKSTVNEEDGSRAVGETDDRTACDSDDDTAHVATGPSHLPPPLQPPLWRRVANWFTATYRGWLIYKSYPVYLAGLSMAFLYMTVMGFDSITTGYGYAMGLSESMLGVIRGLGSIAGILGTFAYPRMRRRIGVTRTGLYALSEEITCLTLCVVSVWTPGSPFNPNYFAEQRSGPVAFITTPGTDRPLGLTDSYVAYELEQSQFNATYTTDMNNATSTLWSTTEDSLGDVVVDGDEEDVKLASLVSPFLFFIGMVLSRIGLWMFDLVITQLIQENVREAERGVFNGIQRSLECMMDMLHFILVILLPSPETFGYLIVLSFAFVCIGAVLYCVFSFRDRGHFFHMEKITVCLSQNGNRLGGQREDDEPDA